MGRLARNMWRPRPVDSIIIGAAGGRVNIFIFLQPSFSKGEHLNTHLHFMLENAEASLDIIWENSHCGAQFSNEAAFTSPTVKSDKQSSEMKCNVVSLPAFLTQ